MREERRCVSRVTPRGMGFFRSNTLFVWVLLLVMFACLVLWAFTGTSALLLPAVLAALGMLYVVLFADL
jgi:hypothetical protein